MPALLGKKKRTNQTTVFVQYTEDSFTAPKKKRDTQSKYCCSSIVDHHVILPASNVKKTDKKDGKKKATKGVHKGERKTKGISNKFKKLKLCEITAQKHLKAVEEIRSFKAIPQPITDFYKCLQTLQQRMPKPFPSNTELFEYLERRWWEFCEDTRIILKANLQPGSIKWGFNLRVGTFPCAILDRIFCLNTQCKKEEIDTSVTVNREVIPYKIFKYSFLFETGFPKLNTDSAWWINLHLPTPQQKDFQRSDYTALTFVCNDFDNRVYVNWEMKNFVLRHNDTEGMWVLTS